MISPPIERILLCNPLANRQHTDVLTEKDECYVGIHYLQEEVQLIRLIDIDCNSVRIIKHQPHCYDAPMNKKA